MSTNEKQNDDETNERMDAWIHGSHLTDNKLLNDTLNNTTVDIGQQKDWSISDYKEERLTTIDGKEYLNQTAKLYYDSKNSTDTDITLNIPKTKDGKDYTIESLAPEQKNVVLAVMDTIVKFLRNDKNYVPFRGTTIMGCGGTGKSYIILLTMIANMTKSKFLTKNITFWRTFFLIVARRSFFHQTVARRAFSLYNVALRSI